MAKSYRVSDKPKGLTPTVYRTTRRATPKGSGYAMSDSRAEKLLAKRAAWELRNRDRAPLAV
ncbi:hypothetical protein GCM10010218_20090 [Streptomyces mashuensis]|uniref:Uncharacterized protein n=1 Tax=Streptomyces mashuensis TaxID=33904 RepID=A0A919B1G3_9ACTN|nr:hypothetical protein GCM10010218_20090 [Streptomyces mashuensis]